MGRKRQQIICHTATVGQGMSIHENKTTVKYSVKDVMAT